MNEDLYDGKVWRRKVIGAGFSSWDFIISICPDGVKFKKKSSLYFVLMLIWNLPPWMRSKRMFLLPLFVLPENSSDHQMYYECIYEDFERLRLQLPHLLF